MSERVLPDRIFGTKEQSFEAVINQLKPTSVAYIGTDEAMKAHVFRAADQMDDGADMVFVDELSDPGPAIDAAYERVYAGGILMGSQWNKLEVQRALAERVSLMQILTFPDNVWGVIAPAPMENP